jgi:methenyltetrahydromethanopterin cyclohydrolase
MKKMAKLSVNNIALKLVKKLRDKANEYRVKVKENKMGTCIIDAGIESKGGFAAGKIITEICLGGLGKTEITTAQLKNIKLPLINVYTDHPSISTLGCQLAGWRIKIGDYFAIASGPARALSLKPKYIFNKIKYKDEANTAILVLETSKEPPTKVIKYISEICRVSCDNLILILAPTTSLVGFIQISGRAAEIGIYKLFELGFDPKFVTHIFGCAPIMPIHPDYVEAMGRTNDALLYAGVTYCIVNCQDDRGLENLVKRSISSASRYYGQSFADIFKKYGSEFYEIDKKIFAPSTLIVNNVNTGSVFSAGKINYELIMKSIKQPSLNS